MSKNNVTNRIAEIKRIALQELPAIMANETDPLIEVKVHEARQVLNLTIIQTVLGAEIINGKKDDKIKLRFINKLPSVSQLSEITAIVSEYTDKYEAPFYAKNQVVSEADDTIDIPEEGQAVAAVYPKLMDIDKISKKKVKEELFVNGAASTFLDANAVLLIASWGEQLRKKQNRNIALIAGGVTLLITAGVVTAVIIGRKKSNCSCDGAGDNIDDIIDGIDDVIDDPETADTIDPDDAPVVELD